MPGILSNLWRLLLGEVSIELVREEEGQGEYETRDDDAEENITHRNGSLLSPVLPGDELQPEHEMKV